MGVWGARYPPTDADAWRRVACESNDFRYPRVRAHVPALSERMVDVEGEYSGEEGNHAAIGKERGSSHSEGWYDCMT